MTNYFVDTENIGATWKHCVDIMDNGDSIFVFYSINPFSKGADRYCSERQIEPELMQKLMQKRINIQFRRIHTGKNALDYQLSSELGRQLCLHPNDEYVIFSQDTGYDSIVEYWSLHDAKVRRVDTVNILLENPASEEDMHKLRNYMAALCISCHIHGKHFDDTVDILVQSKSHIPGIRLRFIRTKLAEVCGNSIGTAIYMRLKDDLHKLREEHIL